MQSEKLDSLHEPTELAETQRRLEALGVRVSKPTLYRWAQKGLIPTTKLGRYRTTVAAVLAALRPAEVV